MRGPRAHTFPVLHTIKRKSLVVLLLSFWGEFAPAATSHSLLFGVLHFATVVEDNGINRRVFDRAACSVEDDSRIRPERESKPNYVSAGLCDGIADADADADAGRLSSILLTMHCHHFD